MKLLKEKRLPFGLSCCYTSQNLDSISSFEFIDQMVEWGAKFVWYFHYMPVGNDAVLDLLPNPKQREFMYHRIREIRRTKPIFAMDFQNDGEYVGGCIAGGRRYLHINANGDVDPCVFIHYSDSNIREKTLLECLQSPIFMEYHKEQPFNENHLRPCPMLENPEKLRYSDSNIREKTLLECLQSPIFMEYHKEQPFNENHLRPCPMLENPEKLRAMVHRTEAVSTDLQSPESVDHLCDKCVSYAENWTPTAQKLWSDSQEKK